MFGIGAGELFVIFIIAIVVIGPNKLPQVARTIGKLIATAKRTSNTLREQMHAEVQKFHEMPEVKEFKQSMESEMYSIHEAAETYVKKEIEEEEKRLEEEARGIDEVLSAAGERMLASGVPEDDPKPEVAASGDSGAAPGSGSESTAGEPSATAPSAQVAEASAQETASHASGSNGSTPGVRPADGEAAAPAKSLS